MPWTGSVRTGRGSPSVWSPKAPWLPLASPRQMMKEPIPEMKTLEEAGLEAAVSHGLPCVTGNPMIRRPPKTWDRSVNSGAVRDPPKPRPRLRMNPRTQTPTLCCWGLTPRPTPPPLGHCTSSPPLLLRPRPPLIGPYPPVVFPHPPLLLLLLLLCPHPRVLVPQPPFNHLYLPLVYP